WEFVGIVGVVQDSSQKQPPRGRPTERAKQGSSWGGRLKIHIIQCHSLALQACCKNIHIIQCPSLALQACCKRLPRRRLHSRRRSPGAGEFIGEVDRLSKGIRVELSLHSPA